MNKSLEYYFEDISKIEILNKLDISKLSIANIKEEVEKYIKENIENKKIKQNEATMMKNVNITGNYSIGKGTKIGNNVTIEGPVIIGENVEIKQNAYIRPYTIILDNASIGFNSEVKSSFIMENAKIASLCFVGDSVIGKSGRIGSGTITANRRFDQSIVEFKDKQNDEKISTNSSFYGIILGNNSRIGANSVTFPGTLIGMYTYIYPLTQVHGFIPSLKKVSNKQELYFTENIKRELK